MQRADVIKRISEVCRDYTDIIGRVVLFGSYSRGDATEGSDVDLYIEPRDTMLTTAKFGANKRYKEFKYALHDLIPLEFDLLAYGGKRDLSRMKRSPLWKQIEQDGVVIYDKGTKAV